MTSAKRGRPKTDTEQFTLRVPHSIARRVEFFVEENFCERADAIRDLLKAGLDVNGVAEPVASPRERKELVQAAKLEREEALAKKQVLTREQVMTFYINEMQIIRSRVDSIPQRVFGLTAVQEDQLRAAIEECYGHIRGDKEEPWDDI